MENITNATASNLNGTLTSASGTIRPHFNWYDYVLTFGLLFFSSAVGIYFGFFRKKQTTAKEYLLGGRQMNVLPAAVSLVLSHTSGSTLLGVPTDVYGFGAMYIFASLSTMAMAVFTVFAYVPVYHELQVTSTYEYLGLRFDDRVRKCSTLLFILAMVMHIPIVAYVASLALSTATGININIIMPIMCAICIFYTSVGGLRALIWIDTFQFLFTFGIVFLLAIFGVHSYGGLEKLFSSKPVQARTDIFDFSLDLTKRETFWALMLGFSAHWLAHCSIDPGCVQKYLSVSTLKESKWVIVLYGLGMASIKVVTVLMGLVLSATYADCDPIVTKQIKKNDEILPYYVLNVTKNLPGIPGLFTAGIITASLSTLSGFLNSFAGTVYAIFLKERLAKRGFENEGLTLKILVVVVGVLSTTLVFLVEKLGQILTLIIGLVGIAYGPLLGIFSLGLFFPTANSKGTFYGAMSSFVVMAVLVGGNNFYKMTKKLVYPYKPISVESCDFFVNTTITSEIINGRMFGKGSDISPIFKISFYWFTFLGSVICIIAGLIFSYITGNNSPPVPRKLLSPIIYPFLSKNRTNNEFVYRGIDDACKRLSVAQDEETEEKTGT